MSADEIETELHRDPFVPLRLHLESGKTFDIPHRDAARVLKYSLLVFIGMKEGTRQAQGYDRFSFDQILRIEQRIGPSSRSKRKKAS